MWKPTDDSSFFRIGLAEYRPKSLRTKQEAERAQQQVRRKTKMPQRNNCMMHLLLLWREGCEMP